MTTPTWSNRPLPTHTSNDFQSLPSIDTGDMNGRFYNPTLIRPRTSSGVERRGRSDILPGTRPPYTHVPPIATNFDSRYVTSSPISKTSSRSNTPRGTPTSTKLPTIRNSILDEVEGSLAATLRDFQTLQGSWHHDSPPATPEQIYGPPPLYQPNGEGQRRGSSTSLQPGDTSFFSLANWDPQQMAAAIAQQQAMVNGNASQSQPNTPLRNGPPVSVLTSDYADFDPKYAAIQQAYEEQKKTIHIMHIESNGAKKQIEFLRARLAEFENDKTTLQQTVRDAEEKIQVTLVKLREAKVGELAAHREIAAAKNTMSIMETRSEHDQKKVKALAAELEGERETVDKVQAKLEEANTHKVDLQEREFENRKEIIVTKKKLKKAVDELTSMKRAQRNTIDEHTVAAEKQRQLLIQTKAELEQTKKQNAAFTELQAQLQAARSEISSLSETRTRLEESQKQNSILESELQKLSLSDLPTRVAEQAIHIEALQSELATRTLTIELPPSIHTPSSTPTFSITAASPTSPHSSSEVDDMRRMMEVMDKTRRDVVAERDRLAALLHAELRRVAVEEHDKKHPSLPFLKGKTDVESTRDLLRSRAKEYVQTHTTSTPGSEKNTEQLEKEIEYYLNDIVLYKLDVKGYKKDLRKAEKRIRELSGLGRSASSDSRLNVSVSPLAQALKTNERGRSTDGMGAGR